MKTGSERGGKGNISFWETHNNQLFFLKNSTNEPNSHIVCVCEATRARWHKCMCICPRSVMFDCVCVQGVRANNYGIRLCNPVIHWLHSFAFHWGGKRLTVFFVSVVSEVCGKKLYRSITSNGVYTHYNDQC